MECYHLHGETHTWLIKGDRPGGAHDPTCRRSKSKVILDAQNEKTAARIPPVQPYVANLLDKIADGKRVLKLREGEKIFSQGDRADAIFLFAAEE